MFILSFPRSRDSISHRAPAWLSSIDVVSKIAEALEVSIDYLVGKTTIKLDHKIIQRIEEIQSLNLEAKNFVLRVLDMALRESKEKRFG